MNIAELLKEYDPEQISIGVLGGHSALDVAHGAKEMGFRTVCVAQKGRERTYNEYYKTRAFDENDEDAGTVGCIDECIVVDKFQDIFNDDVQEKLRELNTIFVQNRYFWVYVDDYARLETDFRVPIFGNRSYVKVEERDQEFNQYHLLEEAGIRIPKMFEDPKEIDRAVLVKACEAERSYERAFFVVDSAEQYEEVGSRLEKEGKVSADWRTATIEEFVVGAHVNFNFFYSPLQDRLEFMGTDTRRQTNLDGFLRMTAEQQMQALKTVPLKMIETGHIACTIKESLVEKAYDLGEKFVAATKKYEVSADTTAESTGIIGPFALQGAVVAEEGREDIVIFDVSMRIPGSPGTRATPYSGYLFGESLSYGERIGMEVLKAVEEGRLSEIVT